MYELVISNLAFHLLASLALVVVAAATSLDNLSRRRRQRTFTVNVATPALVTRIHQVVDVQEDRAEAA